MFDNNNQFTPPHSNNLSLAISVIIPMYNVEKYIEECLLSVLIQTFQDYEVIVIDDCSTDNSVKIVESIASKFNGKLNLIKLEKNSGNAGTPRNIGIDIAKGKYIYFLDSDDVLTHTALEELYGFTTDETIDIIHSDNNIEPIKFNKDIQQYVMTDDLKDANTQFRVVRSGMYNKLTFVTADLSERIINFAKRKFWTTVWRNLYRHDFIVDNNISFIDATLLEDDVFTFECLCLAEKILSIPNAFYVYRMRQDSTSRGHSAHEHHKKLDTIIKIFKSLDEFMKTINIFSDKPKLKYMVFNAFLQKLSSSLTQTNPYELDELVRQELSKDLHGNLALMAYSFNMMNYYHYQYVQAERQITELKKQLS